MSVLSTYPMLNLCNGRWPGRLTCAATLSLGLFLSGCASVSPPVQTNLNETQAQHMAWWGNFNDPLLSQLVQQALQANTSIRSAQASLQQARALRDVKVANSLPGVTLSGSAQRNQTEFADGNNSFRAGLDARWELDVFGAVSSDINASEADTLASQASLRDVQVSIAAEVALAYIQLRGQQAQLAIARNNLGSQSETLQLTDWREQAGLVTSLEVEQAKAATAQTSAQIPALTASIAKTRHALAVLTGQRPLELDLLLSTSQPVPQAADLNTTAIPADTLRQRADVRAAEHRIQAALSRVDAADAARYPSFNLGGSLSLSALTLAGLTNGASLAGSLLGSLSVPLFDAGAGKSQVLAQQAALEQARAAYQNTVLTALKDVEDALISLQSDRQRLQLLQQAATAANNAALLAQNRYSSGLIDFQTVLQTQRTLLSAQDSVAGLQADLSSDHVRLVKALGGGWQ
ncbi:MAG: efflux transporter outer membrane subunit [Rhodoferax sp.]|uniref:efflux transporter outer membrane subunit n=1 Tax=Rhodoferax sp. TaxID=50421 RepID=UPI0026085D17|nr:efflux transporter outer membrane subunit [Rhodoferax sp.]MDD2878964.1 efflux transporter outer membrane subunit [Rhodoferax sp.]